MATAVDQSVTDLYAVRDEADRGWSGDAGPAFRDKMDAGGRRADELRADAERAAQSLDTYADDLTTAQNGMERARQIARDGGLTLAGDTILDPGAGPARPVTLTGAVTAEQAHAYESQVSAYNAHLTKANAYAQAKEQADWSRDVRAFAKDTLANVIDDLKKKPVLVAAGFANEAVIGGAAAWHVNKLKKAGEALKLQSEAAIKDYLKAPGGSPQAKALNDLSWKKFLEADEFERKAARAGSKIGARIPIAGLVITAVDIGYDINTGKPAGKAVISGVGGALAAAGTGAAVGTMIGGPVGTVVGASVGIAVGMVTSGALDAAYDRLPDGTKQAIEDGFEVVGDGAELVGDGVQAGADGAKKLWNSIF
ncbi:WXG100 family type VII secretion target [Actinoplanes xinjiangensis]|uniref:WXG100 family type VII secretion target n=1 Tax=Actinoplanes xinjiangensis TaxID=512350 RepID=UPI00342A4013